MPSGRRQDPYAVLGVSPEAPDEVIRAAYRALAAKYHPDRNPGDRAAELKLKQLNAAWAVLGDPVKKKQYDEFTRSPDDASDEPPPQAPAKEAPDPRPSSPPEAAAEPTELGVWACSCGTRNATSRTRCRHCDANRDDPRPNRGERAAPHAQHQSQAPSDQPTATAVKGEDPSPLWDRLYGTLRAIALVWLAACGIGAVVAYSKAPDLRAAAAADAATAHQPQLYNAQGHPVALSPDEAQQAIVNGDAGFLKTDKVHLVTPRGEVRVFNGADAPKVLQAGGRLATEGEINRAKAEVRQAHHDEQVDLALLAAVAGIAPIGILEALRRWWRWLRH